MSFTRDLYKKIRATLVIQGDGVSRVDTDTLSTVTIDQAAGLAAAVPGTDVGQTLEWDGSAWQPSSLARGSATTIPGTSSGLVALALDGASTSLVLDDMAADEEVGTARVSVRVEDTVGAANPFTDEFTFHLRRSAGNIAVSDGAGDDDSGATATLPLTGPDSAYTYQLDLADAGTGTFELKINDSATARTAHVTVRWDQPQAV